MNFYDSRWKEPATCFPFTIQDKEGIGRCAVAVRYLLGLRVLVPASRYLSRPLGTYISLKVLALPPGTFLALRYLFWPQGFHVLASRYLFGLKVCWATSKYIQYVLAFRYSSVHFLPLMYCYWWTVSGCAPPPPTFRLASMICLQIINIFSQIMLFFHQGGMY
jgi:hypothetical protein